MLFTEMLGMLRRRWLIVVLGLMLTTAASVGVFKVVHPDYTLTREVLLLPPQSETPAGTNPLLALGGLNSAVDVLARALSDDANITDVRAQGATGTFTTTRDQTTSAPMLQVSVTTDTQAEAQKTVGILTAVVPARLSSLQGDLGVPQASHVTSTVLTDNTQPEASRKSQLQAVVGIFALGVLATILLASLIDRMSSRRGDRAVRRSARRDEELEAEPLGTTRGAEKILEAPGAAQPDAPPAVGEPVNIPGIDEATTSEPGSDGPATKESTTNEPRTRTDETRTVPVARTTSPASGAYQPADRKSSTSVEETARDAAATRDSESAVEFESWY